MAEEVALGAAQLVLEAEYSKLKDDLDRVKEELEKGERSFEELTQTATQEGKKLITARRQMTQALLDLTGTESEKEIAALDRKYAGILAKNKAAGESTLALEKALYDKKRAIRLADINEEQMGSNVLVNAKKKVSSATMEYGEAAAKSSFKLGHLKTAGKLLHAQVGQLAAGLKLATIGAWGPYAAAIIATTAIMVKFIDKANAAQDKALQFLATASGQRVGVKQLAVDLEVATGAITQETGALKKQQVEIDALQNRWEELSRVAKDMDQRTFQAGAELLGVKSRKEAQEQADALMGEIVAKKESLELTRKIQVAEAGTKEAEQAAEDKKKGDEFTRKANLERLRDDEKAKATAARIRAEETKDRQKALEDRYAAQASYDKALLALQIDHAEATLEVDATSVENQVALLELQQKQEILNLADHYVKVLSDAAENGIKGNDLMEEVMRKRLEIVDKYSRMIEDAQNPHKPTVEGPVKGRPGWESWMTETMTPEEIRHGLYELGRTQEDIRKTMELLGMSIDEQKEKWKGYAHEVNRVTDGIRDNMELQRQMTAFLNDPTYGLRVNTTPEYEARIEREAAIKYPLLFGPGGTMAPPSPAGSTGGVTVNVNNSSGAEVSVAKVKRGAAGGAEIDIVIAQALLDGGYAARAVKEIVGGPA